VWTPATGLLVSSLGGSTSMIDLWSWGVTEK
jgi:hypothetical protein